MIRSFHKLLIVLYTGVVLFFIVSVYLFAFQSNPTDNRCHGDNTESCLYEENRRSIEHLFAGEKSTEVQNQPAGSSARKFDDQDYMDFDQDYFPEDVLEENFLHLQQNIIDNEEEKRTGKQKTNFKDIPLIHSDSGLRESGRIEHDFFGQAENNHVNVSRIFVSDLNSDHTDIRPFPPVYQAVLPNGLNCSKIWRGDPDEVSRAQVDMNDTLAARRSPSFYPTITENCDKYRRENGYILTVSEEEREFPLAFSVIVYKDTEQFERLIRAVYRPHNAYCIHLDIKTPPLVLEQIRAIVTCLPNVFEAPRHIDVVWGKFSVLEPELICMAALWRMRIKWRYFINLTGQEFPLKTNKELVKILQAYRGANDIMGEIPKERNKWRWAKAGPPPHNISVAKGPVHIAASRGFVDFLLHSPYSRDLLAWTKRTSIPDETFFATINNLHRLKVPGSYTGSLTSRRRIMINRFKIWDISNKTCSGKFVRHICHFGMREVATLAHSRHLVANKFTYNFYPLAYDCTEQWYFDRVRKEEETGVVDINTRYYSNMEIVKYAYREEGE